MPDTVRARLDAIEAITTQCFPSSTIDLIRKHAEAALKLLDEAERSYGNGTRPDAIHRLVPDADGR